MTRFRLRQTLIVAAMLVISACSNKPGVDGLKDSFAQQLASNKAITDFVRNGDDMTFSGPGVDGGAAKWRVHINSTAIEKVDDERAPFKGTVTSSWYANDQEIKISASGKDSNLPVPLTATGLAQVCWALWDPNGKKWGWD